MTAFIVNPKYKQNSMVQYSEKPGEIKIGKIVGVFAWQSSNMRPECCMISYNIIPKEFIGFECDEEIRISECNKEDSFPHILCTV